jgi:hypothetical protein
MNRHREGDRVRLLPEQWKDLAGGYRIGVIEAVEKADYKGTMVGSYLDLAIVRFGEAGGTDSYCWLPDNAIVSLEVKVVEAPALIPVKAVG